MMTPATVEPWFPLFEFQEWTYQSVLFLPTAAETSGLAGIPVTAKKWARGAVALGQAFHNQDGYILGGTLSLAPEVELDVSAKGALGLEGSPGTFEATGTGTDGKTKGAIYELRGWVFPDGPSSSGTGRVSSIRGSVRAIRGTAAKPDTELGGMPLGTVGLFEIVRTKQ